MPEGKRLGDNFLGLGRELVAGKLVRSCPRHLSHIRSRPSLPRNRFAEVVEQDIVVAGLAGLVRHDALKRFHQRQHAHLESSFLSQFALDGTHQRLSELDQPAGE
jgi:hypothetical protein